MVMNGSKSADGMEGGGVEEKEEEVGGGKYPGYSLYISSSLFHYSSIKKSI